LINYFSRFIFSLIKRYGTFAYKALVKIPWVAEEEYFLALQDAREVTRKEQEDANAKAAHREGITYNILSHSDNTF
jgi:hypothetical protein